MLRLVGERILELVFPHIRSRKAVLFALRTQGSASLYPGLLRPYGASPSREAAAGL